MTLDNLYIQLALEYLPYGGLDRQADDIRFIFSVMLPDADHIAAVYRIHAAGDIRALKALLQLAPHLIPRDILGYASTPAKADLILTVFRPQQDAIANAVERQSLLMIRYYLRKQSFGSFWLWEIALKSRSIPLLMYAYSYLDDHTESMILIAGNDNVVALRIMCMLADLHPHLSYYAAQHNSQRVIRLLLDWTQIDLQQLLSGAAAGNKLAGLQATYREDPTLDINNALDHAIDCGSFDTAEQLCIWGARAVPELVADLPMRLRQYHL